MGTIGIIILVALLFLGAPLFAVLIAAGALGAIFTAQSGGHSFWTDFLGQISDINTVATGEEATVLSTIPLFIFAGYLMAEAKTADRLVNVAKAALGWLPGGLAVVTIFACALFTTFTGASGVTIVALGGLLLPSLVREGYPEGFALGLVGGTGSVGLLFPPAVPIIIYGTVYGLNAQTRAGTEIISFTTDRFLLAGVLPGLVLIGILSLYSIYRAIKLEVPRQPFVAADLGKAFLRGIPELAIPFLVIAALANGVQLPEVAALTVVYVLLLEVVVYRDVHPKALFSMVRESMILVGAIFIIIFAAQVFTNYLKTAQVPDAVFEWINSRIESKWVFLLALNLLLLAVGMTMDIFSAIVVVVPLIIRPAAEFGIDPFHLGVIFLLNLEIGYLTPPVGLNLFITSFTFKKPILEVTRATLPFLACMVVALGIVTYVPALTVYPEAKRRGLIQTMIRDFVDTGKRAGSVDDLVFENGKKLTRSDCEKIANEFDKLICLDLFVDVTECRQKPSKEDADVCEKKALRTYQEDTEEDEDLDF